MKRQSIAEQTLEKANRALEAQMQDCTNQIKVLQTKYETLAAIRQGNDGEIYRLKRAREVASARQAEKGTDK